MKKLFTLLSAMLLATGAFAATEQAWYNDVTSITNNGQYYIYSVNGKGFMQGGNSKVKSVNSNNYSTESNLLFTISTSNKRTYSGSNYLCSYETKTCGPVGSTSSDGSTMIWESKSGYWLVYGSYTFIWAQKAYLRYEDNAYAATCLNPSLDDNKFKWYLISQAQYNRHFAIYFFDAYKETLNIAQYENLVPAAYYTALQTAYNKSFSVKNATHSAEVVNAAKANLEALYTGAPAVAQAYANANEAVNTLEAVEDKGEDFAEVTTDIANARTAIEAAMTVDALNAAVAGLKAIDPITFNVTEFEAPNFVTNAASSAAGRTISYDAADKAIINADGKAIYAGTTTLTATAAATDQYYKFVRSTQVTVTAPTKYGEFEEHSCDTPVEFNGQSYDASFAGDIKVGLNYMGGDSIVHVAITINHATFGTDAMSIVYGDEAEWNGISLKDSTVGVHTVIFVTSNAAGCDSTVTLTLTVNKQETVEMEPVMLSFCPGDSVEYRGKWYYENALDTIYAEGDVRDTIIYVEAMLLPTTDLIVLYDTIVSGNEVILPEGEWVIGEDTVSGTYPTVESEDASELIFHQYFDEPVVCGPNYIELIVTVTPKEQKPGETTAFERVNANSEAVKEFRNGTLYIRRGERLFTAEGREVK